MKFKKVKLKDLTEQQYEQWYKDNCFISNCLKKCIFSNVKCGYTHKVCWIYHKDLYSDKFLNQKIKVEK